MSVWYRKVQNDLTEIPNCISYFENEINTAKTELSLKGKSIEKHSAELPGIVEYRFCQLQEIEAILEYLNIQLKKTRSEKFKYYLEGYKRALTSRDVDKYVDGNPDVIDMMALVNEFALLRNKFLGITKGLETKNWMIGHIVKLRVSGIEDASI